MVFSFLPLIYIPSSIADNCTTNVDNSLTLLYSSKENLKEYIPIITHICLIALFLASVNKFTILKLAITCPTLQLVIQYTGSPYHVKKKKTKFKFHMFTETVNVVFLHSGSALHNSITFVPNFFVDSDAVMSQNTQNFQNG